MRATLILFILCLIFLPLSTTAENQTVIINEVAWMGTTASANDEWIELYNITDAAIDITGWKLQTTDGGLLVELTGSIAAHGYYLLERTDDDTIQNILADTIYTGSLSNSGEELELTDATDTTVDRIDALTGWPGGDNTTKQTLERIAGAWQTSAVIGGTPKAQNSISAPATDIQPNNGSPAATSTPVVAPSEKSDTATNPKRDEIVFTEVFPNPIGPDDNEFIELENKSVRSIDLTTWIIETSGGQQFELPSLTMFPGSVVTLHRDTTRLALRNSKERITLTAPGQKIISSVEWKKPAPEGKSLQRARDGSYDWAPITPGYHASIEPVIAPTATIVGPSRAMVGDIILFDGSDSFDPLNRPLTLRWQLGDGRIAFGTAARQLFTVAGTYDVMLTAYVNERASSTEVLKITITGNTAPSIADEFTNTTATENLFAASPLPSTVNTHVILSEFLPNPAGSDNQEFIELFNIGSTLADVSAWQLDDMTDGSHPYRIPDGTTIQPGQYRAFFKNETRISLNNDYDEVRLITPYGEEVDVSTYDEVREGASYVLTEDGDWQMTDTPTPNELNALTAPPTSTTSAAEPTPRVLGAATAEQIPAPAPNRALRYVISGAAIMLVLGATVATRKRHT